MEEKAGHLELCVFQKDRQWMDVQGRRVMRAGDREDEWVACCDREGKCRGGRKVNGIVLMTTCVCMKRQLQNSCGYTM